MFIKPPLFAQTHSYADKYGGHNCGMALPFLSSSVYVGPSRIVGKVVETKTGGKGKRRKWMRELFGFKNWVQKNILIVAGLRVCSQDAEATSGILNTMAVKQKGHTAGGRQ